MSHDLASGGLRSPSATLQQATRARPLRPLSRDQAPAPPTHGPTPAADRYQPPDRLRAADTVIGQVDRLMARHDRNHNGVIDLRPNGDDDRLVETAMHRETDYRVSVYHYRGPAGSAVKSMLPLFDEADTNHDDDLTAKELETFIATRYDTNGNGWMEQAVLSWGPTEWDHYAYDFGMR